MLCWGGGGKGNNLHFFDLESVHRGIHFSDNSKHFCNTCSVSIVKNPTKNKFLFMSGARGAATGAAPVRYALSYSVLNDRDKRINGMF